MAGRSEEEGGEVMLAGVRFVDRPIWACGFPLWGHQERPPIEQRMVCGRPRWGKSPYCEECSGKAFQKREG